MITHKNLSIYRFDHILHDFLSITKDHHGFVHVEELIVETIKNKDLERYKKEQEKPNLSIKKIHPKLNTKWAQNGPGKQINIALFLRQ